MNDKTKTTEKADETKTAKAKNISVLALHTVTRPDDMGGMESNPRGSVFSVDESELERLQRVGAVRKATADEVKAFEKGNALSVNEPVSGSYSQTEAAGQATAARITGDVAEYEGETDVGAGKTTTPKASK